MFKKVPLDREPDIIDYYMIDSQVNLVNKEILYHDYDVAFGQTKH